MLQAMLSEAGVQVSVKLPDVPPRPIADPVQLQQVILNLMDMTWLDQAFNVCLLGPTSTGKTMLATILGYEALDRGYDVCFEETDTPVHVPETKDFVPASERRVRDLTRARLVIVDEIGYIPKSLEAQERRHKLI